MYNVKVLETINIKIKNEELLEILFIKKKD